MSRSPTDDVARAFLAVALEEARTGLAEGGIPIGAALFHRDGTLLGRGHNRRVQDGDASTHAETAAFRERRAAAALRRLRHGDHPLSVLVLQRAGPPVPDRRGGHRRVGELHGGHDWVAEHGAEVIVLDDPACIELLGTFIAEHPELWNEDIGL